VADAGSQRQQQYEERDGQPGRGFQASRGSDADGRGIDGERGHAGGERLEGRSVPTGKRGNERTPWEASDLVWCRDGKRRPVEPGTFPLAHGVSGRVGLLRGYGNAIVPQVAAEFISAYLDTRGSR
jgi:DNA (cytosine-5)-methyltransferase 1